MSRGDGGVEWMEPGLDQGLMGGVVTPALQDGGVVAGMVSPGFTRGYFQALPPGAGQVGVGAISPIAHPRKMVPITKLVKG